jgi:hypothetical protein
MLYLCVTPEREEKTARLMEALSAGASEPTKIITGPPPDDGNPFVVWGQVFLAADIIPVAIRSGRPFWQIDNGFWQSARGGETGYYRFSYRGLSPVLLQHTGSGRPPAKMAPWRKGGEHIVLGVPGENFGRSIGLDMPAWTRLAYTKLQRSTRRPIMLRRKGSGIPLADDLRGAWALVTHSSNVAVDSVLAGIPVFVADTSPAAPVARIGLGPVESPAMPDREAWWNSLMCQQFTLAEMANGIAWKYMDRVCKQVEG